ncbi:MAG: signal peptide peptidase SppA, partial [Candidatus Babeliales bacterium]
SIKAILLRIDCGGGAAGTSQAVYNELTYLKQQYPNKPVVVFIENMCASGAYYIACPCDWIVAAGSSFIGSIGVYIALPRLKEFINQYKIEYQLTKTGKYKAILNPLLDTSKDEQELLQELCNDTYQQFIEDVAKSRPVLALKNADKWANGTIFTGKQALGLNLIDQIGSLSHVEQQIRERAHIPSNQEIQWVKAEQKNMLMKLLSPDDSGESNDDMSLSNMLQSMFNSWMNQQTIARM